MGRFFILGRKKSKAKVKLRPLLAILGVGSGIEGVEESLKDGNYAQAAERALVLSLALKSLKTDLFDTTVCFTGDTLVYTGEGYKEIQDIKAGDEVYSENPETGERGLKKVAKVFVKEVHQIVHIVADGEDINTTPTHPFWVEGKGWTEAGDIKAGDKLKMYSGEILEVKNAYVEYLENPVKVYNFEVEDWHTYFVSKESVFVHNADFCNTTKPINRPSAKKVEIDMEEVMTGHTSDGARAKQSQIKDLFPDDMSESAIEKEIRTAYKNSKQVGSPQFDGQQTRIKLQGQGNRGVVEMWYNKDTKIIETAYPISGKKVKIP